jgi:hypothetical protein
MTESLVTIRVPRETKERMKKAGLNWSEELRKVIEERLSDSQRKEARKELEGLLRSVKPGFDSTRQIKEARRHG